MISIIQGDATKLIEQVSTNSIDMVFTDPPYGHNNNNGDLISRWEAALGKGDYIPERDNRPIANDGKEAEELFRIILPELERVLKPGSVCCCCGGGGPDPMFARWSLLLDKVFEFKQMVVWDKGPMGMGWHYRRSYETVLVAKKKGAACRWYDKSHMIENVIRHIPKIIPSKQHHPTQKPEGLSSHFIKLHTQPGDTVLDPFCGSGTTLISAHKLGCNAIGYELDEKFYKMAQNRATIEAEQITLALEV